MRVLVVDDHLPTLDLMRLTLTSLGHTVSSATNVIEALELVDTDAPDLILSDLTFSSGAGREPDDGHALARAVRSRPGHERIGLLAITGVVSPSELQAAIDSGFDGVVVKPFDLDSLIERIDAFGQEGGPGPSGQ